jgi:hypothetical protein
VAALLSRSAAIGELRVIAVPAGDEADALREVADLLDQLADPVTLRRRLAGGEREKLLLQRSGALLGGASIFALLRVRRLYRARRQPRV